MATAANLIIGNDYPVKAGDLAGQSVTIIDNIPVPDGQENQRKVLVRFQDDTEGYILPRLLDDGTVTPGEAQRLGGPASAPTPHTANETKVVTEDSVPISDPMDPRLDSFRPDPKIVRQYMSRTLPGGRKDTEVLLSYWRDRKNLFLVGDTQSGKTMLVQVIAVLAAKEAGLPKPYPVFTLSGSNGVTDFDLFGQPTAYTDPGTGVERLVWLPGLVDIACRVGGFLYLDEANMMEDRVVSSLNPVCDDRRFFVNRQKAVKVPGDGFMPEIVPASENLWIIGTYNDGYKGAGALQEAFSNRFIHLPWDYDEAVEKKLIKSVTIREIVADALRTARQSGTIHTPVGTRALQELEHAAFTHGVEYALWAFSGMFPGRDRERVEVILRDRSVESSLQAEVDAAAAAALLESEEITTS